MLCSNNLEPAVHKQIMLAAENGTYNSTIYSLDTVGILKRNSAGNWKRLGYKAGSSGPEMLCLCHVQINKHPCLHHFAFSLNGARLQLQLPVARCVASQT